MCWALEKRIVVLLGGSNARVGRAVDLDVDDVASTFGEDTCGNRLISFLNEVESCNDRKLVAEPEWTRVRPSMNHKSIRCSVDESFKVCACR